MSSMMGSAVYSCINDNYSIRTVFFTVIALVIFIIKIIPAPYILPVPIGRKQNYSLLTFWYLP